MKLCIILLSLGGLIGGVEKVIDTPGHGVPKPEVVFSQNAPLAIPAVPLPDPERSVRDALADAPNHEVAISDLFHAREDQ